MNRVSVNLRTYDNRAFIEGMARRMLIQAGWPIPDDFAERVDSVELDIETRIALARNMWDLYDDDK